MQKKRVEKIVSFAVSVYAPMFLSVHFCPSVPEGPGNMLYCRDLLLSHKSIDDSHFNVNVKCFIKHACNWLKPTNVALAAYSKNPPYTIQQLSDPSQRLPRRVSTAKLVMQRKPLKAYFTVESKTAPCVVNKDPLFWKRLLNHNQVCERFVGKVKNVLENNKIRDFQNNDGIRATDMKVRSYVCNMVFVIRPGVALYRKQGRGNTV